jgi:methylmalonyl-CoA carboxyltransferase large subunit
MAKVTISKLSATVEQLQAQMAELSRRLARYEVQDVLPLPTVRVEQEITAIITEEELILISAAIGAYLGVHAHIRQIRLVSTTAWAQQGRVSIQASHRL